MSLLLKTARSIPLLYGLLTVVACDSSRSKTDWEWDANNDPNGTENGSSNKASQQYVTASGLSLRIAPNTGATRTNVLPSGTRILVEQTTSPLVVDGQIGHWYRAVEFDGYVAGHFIAPVMGTETAPYVLESSTYSNVGHSNQRLILQAGRARYLYASYNLQGVKGDVIEQIGSYEVLPQGIHVTLESGNKWVNHSSAVRGLSGGNAVNGNDCAIESNHIPRSCMIGAPSEAGPFNLTLSYCPDLGGFGNENCDSPNEQATQVNRDSCHWASNDDLFGPSGYGWWCTPTTPQRKIPEHWPAEICSH
jgi:hypothetical protein